MATIAKPEACDGHTNDEAIQTDKERKIPLRECVRTAIASYLDRMGEYQVDNLHRFVLDEVERPLLETVMEHARGNQTLAARMLGISRGTLRKKVAHYGLISANDPK